MDFDRSCRDRSSSAQLLFVFLCVCVLNLAGPLARTASATPSGCVLAENGLSFTYNQDWAQIIISQPLNAGDQFTVTFDTYSNDNGNGPEVKEIYLGQGDAWADANINAFAHFTLSGPGTFGPFTVPSGGISQLSMAVQSGSGTMNATGTVTCGLTPKVTSVSPASGPAAGGTSVTITGVNFSNAHTLEFGGTDASFTVVNSTTITATTPAHAAGLVDVVVMSCYGTGTGSGLFTYIAPAPSVTSVSPPVGPAGGGTTITISGSNLTGATGVSVGGVAASAFTVLNATTISAATPIHAAGAVDIAVTTAGGTGTGAGIYTYIATPAITGISPANGPVAGGTTITVTGMNLTGATSLMIGGAAAPNVVVVNATTITATTPAHAAGTVDVSVTTSGGTGSGAALYTFAAGPVITSITPSQGLVAGGTPVTITGSGLAGTTELLVGGIAATAITVVDDTRLTATTPAHAAGPVDITLTTPGGSGSGAALYRYYSALALASTPSAVMRVGEPYSQANAATDGTPAYTYSLLSGALPAGLSLDPSTGLVSGTPTTSGTFSYAIEVADSSSPRLTAAQTLTGTIAAITTTMSVASSMNPTLIGEPTTLTAAITPVAATGAVTFKDGETILCDAVPLTTGRALCTAPFTTAGVHSITAVYGGTSSYASAISAALVQTVTDQRQKTTEAIGTFMNRRNDLIVANEPDASRQIDRLIEADAPTQVAARRSGSDAANSLSQRAMSTADGNQMPTLTGQRNREASSRGISLMTGPMRVRADMNGPLHAEIATSVAQILRAAGADAGSGRSRFDVSVEANYGRFNNGSAADDDGRFGLMSIGADYVVSRRLLLGTMLQFDTMRERSTAQATEVNGHGWTLGPYATVRLSDHLFWQGRTAWGTASNEVRPFLTYTDEFSSTRWLVTSTLSGNWSAGRWMVRPAVSVSHFAESAGTYVDRFGVEIPEITSRLGQARLGPEVQYVYRVNRSIRLQPRAGLELVSNFSGEATAAGVSAVDGGAGSRTDTRGRSEFGVRAITSRGVSMDLSGTYDGIGTPGFGAFAGRLLVNVPMK